MGDALVGKYDSHLRFKDSATPHNRVTLWKPPPPQYLLPNLIDLHELAYYATAIPVCYQNITLQELVRLWQMEVHLQQTMRITTPNQYLEHVNKIRRRWLLHQHW